MTTLDQDKPISYAPYIWQAITGLIGAAIDLWKSDVIQSLLTSKTLGYIGDFDTECTTASETIFLNIGIGFALIIMVYWFNKVISQFKKHTWLIFSVALISFLGLTILGQIILKNEYNIAKDQYVLECPDTRVEGTGQAFVIMPETPIGELKELNDSFHKSPTPGEDNICARDGAMSLMTLIHSQESNRVGATQMCSSLKIRYLLYTLFSQFALALILAFVIGTIIFVAKDIYNEAKAAGRVLVEVTKDISKSLNTSPPPKKRLSTLTDPTVIRLAIEFFTKLIQPIIKIVAKLKK